MIRSYDPILQSLIASLFTWGVTALGASLVFILPSNSKKFLDASLGFAGGVMTAASFWSLLAPAIEISENTMGSFAFVPVAIGFSFGALFVRLTDKLIPSCVVAELSLINAIQQCEGHNSEYKKSDQSRQTSKSSKVTLSAGYACQRMVNDKDDQAHCPSTMQSTSVADGISSENNVVKFNKKISQEESLSDSMISWRRILLLIMAVTVHNIPEGLAVGVGFGSIGKTPAATFEKAFNLALGIGLQNFPEGLAVSLPLSGFGYSKFRAFLYGQLSGIVEPFAALLGAYAILLMEPALPYALSFAAGAMIYVVFDDIIPEAQRNNNSDIASLGAILGFLVMMCMDVGLG